MPSNAEHYLLWMTFGFSSLTGLCLAWCHCKRKSLLFITRHHLHKIRLVLVQLQRTVGHQLIIGQPTRTQISICSIDIIFFCWLPLVPSIRTLLCSMGFCFFSSVLTFQLKGAIESYKSKRRLEGNRTNVSVIYFSLWRQTLNGFTVRIWRHNITMILHSYPNMNLEL